MRLRSRPAIDAMLRFHEELSFVFPEHETLGSYVPRPIKDQIPPGWETGDPGPGSMADSLSASSTRGVTASMPASPPVWAVRSGTDA